MLVSKLYLTHNNTTVLGPDMSVVKEALNKTVYLGEQTEFLITVNNTGDCSLGNVTVVEKVPAGLTFDDYANVTGSWKIEKINETAYRFILVGDLAEGGIASFKVIFNTTIVELDIAGYTKEITNIGNNFTVTNTHKVNLTEINVTKVWNDSYQT